MIMNREQSLNFGENSLIQNNNLNETQLSHLTKESGEKDFKELESLINRAVRDDTKSNISILSTSKIVDKSNSILSNEEIWNGNNSPDDSKNFIINYKDLDGKKKISELLKENKNKKRNKPKDLCLTTQLQKQAAENIGEDYNEDIDESVGTKKEEQITQMVKLETKNNNLNECFTNKEDSKIRFYTSPDDVYFYRNGYPYNNFSFTPQSQLNINDQYPMNQMPLNVAPMFPIFPTIPSRYGGGRMDIPKNELKLDNELFTVERNSNSTEKEQTGYKNKENVIQNVHAKTSAKNVGSTRNSTEENESGAEVNANNKNRKFFTPTHMNTNYNRNYNFSQVQRELDFSGVRETSMNSQMSKFPGQNTKTPTNVTKPVIQVGGSSLFSPSNSNSNMSMKSLSFCGNPISIKSPTALSYNVTKPIVHSNTLESKFSVNQKEEYFDFKINLENIIIGKDRRTTLMLRNIPNKYTLQNLVDEVNSHFMGKYDYINLPIDYERKLNLGYAFINFIDPMHIVMFYETYYNKKWSRYKSDKKIDLNYAEKQGKKDISCKDENTYFASEDKKINFKKLTPKLELPMKYFDFFKKIYPTSVCIVENKSGIVGEKTFHVKSIGKR